MTAKQSLNQLINQKVLPRLLSVVSVLTVVLMVMAFLFAQQALKQRHDNYIQDMQSEIILAMEGAVLQVSNLASNDLVVNSLVDVSQRENYLPLFFQSLKISNIGSISIAFFDFTGERIISKNWDEYIDAAPDFDWSTPVLEGSQSFTEFSAQGVLIASPVLLGEMAEGAIVLYNNSLQDLVVHKKNTGIQLVVGKGDGQVLFSSSPEEFPVQSYFDLNSDLEGYSQLQMYPNYAIVSMEETAVAYKSLPWVVLSTLLSATVIFIVSLYSTRLAVRHAGITLRGLNQEIANQISGVANDKRDEEPQARELLAIKQSFQDLMEKLVRTTVSKDKLSGVINSMSEMVLVIDNDKNVVLQNHAFMDFAAKVGAEQLEIGAVIPATLLENQTNSEREHEQYYQLADSNTSSCILWHTTDFTDQDGVRIGTVFVGEDVTLKRELQADLLMKTQAIDEAKTSIVISDISKPNQPVVYVNKAYQALTGYRSDEIIGGNCKSLQGKDTSEEDINKIRQAIRDKQPIDITLLNYRKDGTSFFNRLTLTPIHNSDNSVTHYIGIQQDVTNEEQAAKFLREAKLRAEESARLKSGFLASMSHEIRTPINGISGMLELLKASGLNDKQSEFADLAKQSTDNLLHIVNDILDFSKIEAGKLSVESTEFNLSRLIELTSEHFKVELLASKLEFEVATDFSPDVIVIGDPIRLRQVISNLISNAIKFTEQGKVTLNASLVTQSDGVPTFQCAISDTGIGITEEKLEHIFDVFTQEDVSTTREFGGTGLGLSICQQLCELMGGEISVTSEKDKGSIFSFRIPLKLGKPKRKTPPVRIESEGAETQQRSNDSKDMSTILLVEDNEINQIIAKNQLEHYCVLVANNGREALDILAGTDKKIDLIIMDCQMPEMDGYEATKRIRAGEVGEEISDIPIIALTANAMVGDKEKCFDAGMNDYLSKPFAAEDLLAKVHGWLNSTAVD